MQTIVLDDSVRLALRVQTNGSLIDSLLATFQQYAG